MPLTVLMIDQFYKFLLLAGGTVLLFHAFPQRFKWTVLLVASYWLYLSLDPNYWWLLPAVTLEIYLVALLIASSKREGARGAAFWLGTTLALAPLLRFKYSELFTQGFDVKSADTLHYMILPLGISFYTFQAISYLYDVYKRRIAANRHLGLVSLYIAFFPHLLAGPIVRPETLITQLESPEQAATIDWGRGLRQIFSGFFKKFVLANNLHVFVSVAMAFPEKFRGFPFILALALFRFQLYYDIAGYSDIAIGAGRLFGVNLPANFDRPFAATSPGDFWRRWHMTVVSWFRDHVYFPLCRLFPNTGWFVFALLLNMTLVGLWHGPGWNWAVFGLLNGALILLDAKTSPARRKLRERLGISKFPRLHKLWAIPTTFALCSIPGLFAFSHGSAGSLAEFEAFTRPQGSFFNVEAFEYFFEHQQTALVFGSLLVLIGIMETLEWVWTTEFKARWDRLPLWQRYPAYAAAMGALILFGSMDNLSFIYFQF